jgi:hypothetical protein
MSKRRRRRKRHLFQLTLAGLPELEHFETDEQRQEAFQDIGSEAGTPVSFGFWFAIFILVGAVITARALAKWVLAHVYWPEPVEEALSWLVILLTFGFVLRWLHRSGVRRELREKLLTQGVPVCMQCGYLLRGLPLSSSRCPECGGPFDDRVIEVLKNVPTS